ncbi:SDR family NAD(P)-dependent oxidoreductase [Rhodococcus sp. C3V]|uniref:SDR family NAD(P)-dependent oxidoreductase n=1 Tax=Rhodococcus sp. C3V TaxID=3034165 RepID=UPI0023E0CACF|nr:SDR family NAD(P)-dependent oxidoreductase [Rhodococcus sp. C3V]MDF3319983.1 SDR family NAD(P)-dependent oxidoreductase [Rhodococcus sp. C3V]
MTNSRTAIITGGAGGLGRATAKRLRLDGVRVITLDREGGDFDLDIADMAAVQQVAEEIGDVDVLVNAAGIVGRCLPLLQTTPADWQKVYDVNVFGTVNAINAFVPPMVDRGWGRVVNVASVAGLEGNAEQSIYSSSKAAVIGLTKSVGKELAESGVLVNAIAPAVFETPIIKQGPAALLTQLSSKIPMGRIGRPEEIAELIAFLTSERVSFSTGAVFDVTGGRASY